MTSVFVNAGLVGFALFQQGVVKRDLQDVHAFLLDEPVETSARSAEVEVSSYVDGANLKTILKGVYDNHNALNNKVVQINGYHDIESTSGLMARCRD